MEKSSDKHVEGPPGVNVSDGFGGVRSPGLKSLALVDNNSLSRGDGWRQFVGSRRLLQKVGHSIGV